MVDLAVTREEREKRVFFFVRNNCNFMFLTPQKRVWIVIAALFALVIMVIITPFVVNSGFGFFPREAMQAFFVIAEFFGTVYLLKEFDRLRVIIKKQEKENKKLSDIESDIRKLSNSK
jgi:hypothetical protein